MGTLPSDYPERAYAAVLGKLIGVYLGRPFENWTHQRIMRELGPIDDYVHERLGCPLVVTDDDVAGTFTFVRALEDHGTKPDISSREIGQTWLNYIVENRSILWWGGAGNSTEHTACAGERLDRDQRQDSRRTDRSADFHRRLGHRRGRRPGSRGAPR